MERCISSGSRYPLFGAQAQPKTKSKPMASVFFGVTGLSMAASIHAHTSMDVQHAANRIHLTGCPTQGIERGCLVLADKTGKTYDISAARARDLNNTGQPEHPRTGFFAIKLDGTVSEGAMGICMQGVILKDITWTYTEKKCDDQEVGGK